MSLNDSNKDVEMRVTDESKVRAAFSQTDDDHGQEEQASVARSAHEVAEMAEMAEEASEHGKCPFMRASESGSLSQAAEKAKKKKGVKLKFLLDETTTLDTLFHKSITKIACNEERLTQIIIMND